MSYIKYTNEDIQNICKQYKTRGELKREMPSIYALARRRKILDGCCSHMWTIKYSTPQLILKHLLEIVLNDVCVYNTRKIIPPFELDVYFKSKKLAFEYNGKTWHSSEKVKNRDNNKKLKCEESKIRLIIIEENENQDYEHDIKEQLISHIGSINLWCDLQITPQQIMDVCCDNVYNDIINYKDKDTILQKIAECNTISEFIKKYEKEYGYIRRIKHLHLLDSLRKDYKIYSREYILSFCDKVSTLKELRDEYPNMYHLIRKRGLYNEATKHMKKRGDKYSRLQIDSLLKLANTFKHKTDIRNRDNLLFLELKRRDVFHLLKYGT